MVLVLDLGDRKSPKVMEIKQLKAATQSINITSHPSKSKSPVQKKTFLRKVKDNLKAFRTMLKSMTFRDWIITMDIILLGVIPLAYFFPIAALVLLGASWIAVLSLAGLIHSDKLG